MALLGFGLFGESSWQGQWVRVKRFYARYCSANSQVDQADALWSFVLASWTLTAWITEDPYLTEEQKGRIRHSVENSDALMINADLANHLKHPKLKQPKRLGARITGTNANVGASVRTSIRFELANGAEGNSTELVEQIMYAWSQILSPYVESNQREV